METGMHKLKVLVYGSWCALDSSTYFRISVAKWSALLTLQPNLTRQYLKGVLAESNIISSIHVLPMC
jgi:hypothetical protein